MAFVLQLMVVLSSLISLLLNHCTESSKEGTRDIFSPSCARRRDELCLSFLTCLSDLF